MTFVIWCSAVLFIPPPHSWPFWGFHPLSTPETVLCLQLSDTAGCSRRNAAVEVLGMLGGPARWAARSSPGPKAGGGGGGCFLGKPADW